MLNVDTPGYQLGRLTIGDICRHVSLVPPTTPRGYLIMGELRFCDCECGKQVVYPTALLRKGQIKSCGCLRAEKKASRAKINEARYFRKQLKQRIKKLQSLMRESDCKDMYAIQAEIVQIKKAIKKSLGKKEYKPNIIGPNGVTL